MTEPVKQDETPVIVNNGQAPVTAPPADEEAWWTEAQKDKGFKSKEEVWKSYKESERKISEDGEKLKLAQTFQDNVVPFLDVVIRDPEIMKQVKAKMENPDAVLPTTPAPVDNSKTTPPVDTDTKKYLLDDAVASFEKSHGIDKLDAETQKEVKAKIGIEFRKFTNGEVKVSLVKDQLQDAFKLAVANDENLQKIFAPKDDSLGDYGSMPSQASGLDKDGNIKLTPEEEKVAERMPGGRDAYIKGKKKILGK